MSNLLCSLRLTLVLFVLTGLVYPLLVMAAAQTLFPRQANGSLVEVEGGVVGSQLIGQAFTDPGYFHPRPSAAGNGYDAALSGGTNLGPTNPKLLDGRVDPADPSAGFHGVRQLAEQVRTTNGLPPDAPVPVDAVTRSASGLDPHISPAYADLQVPRVARARGLSEGALREVVRRATEGRTMGVLGEPRVNVLRANLLLDQREAR